MPSGKIMYLTTGPVWYLAYYQQDLKMSTSANPYSTGMKLNPSP